MDSFYNSNSTSTASNDTEPKTYTWIIYRVWRIMPIYTTPSPYDVTKYDQSTFTHHLATKTGTTGRTQQENHQLLLLLIPFILLCGILALLIAMLIMRARFSKLVKSHLDTQNSRRRLASLHRASNHRHQSSNCYAEPPTSIMSTTNLKSSQIDVAGVHVPQWQRQTNNRGSDDVNYAEIEIGNLRRNIHN